MTIRQLAAQISSPDSQYRQLRGASYGGIRQYVEGGVRNPRTELLRAIADVLGVRWRWLAFNEGFMTAAQEAEEANTPLKRDPALIQRTTSAVLEALFEEMPRLRPIGQFGIDKLILACVPEVAFWIGRDGLGLPGLGDAEGEQDGHQRYVQAARMLGQAVAAPIRALRLDPAEWPESAKSQYLAVVMPALVPLIDLQASALIARKLGIAHGDDHGQA